MSQDAALRNEPLFRILDTYPPRVFPGVTNQQNAEMAMLTERLDRLTAIARRVEGD